MSECSSAPSLSANPAYYGHNSHFLGLRQDKEGRPFLPLSPKQRLACASPADPRAWREVRLKTTRLSELFPGLIWPELLRGAPILARLPASAREPSEAQPHLEFVLESRLGQLFS